VFFFHLFAQKGLTTKIKINISLLSSMFGMGGVYVYELFRSRLLREMALLGFFSCYLFRSINT